MQDRQKMAELLRSGIKDTAKSLGISPVDLATAISYETAGTFDPTKRGPTTQWGQHRGLIQFGEPQAQKYGVDWSRPLESQLGPDGAVARYLRDTGVKPGMGLLDVYSAINAGGVGRYNRTDANNGGAPGTVRDKVERQMGGHRAKAAALLGVADAPGAFVAADRQRQPQDPGMYAEAPPQAMGMPAARQTMQQTEAPAQQPMAGPDGQQLYKVGTLRDPAGGGMIDNIATQATPTGIMQGLARDAQLSDLYNKLFGG
jgi:hypothetical protein